MNKRFARGVAADLYFQEMNLATKSGVDSSGTRKMGSTEVDRQSERGGQCAVGAWGLSPWSQLSLGPPHLLCVV